MQTITLPSCGFAFPAPSEVPALYEKHDMLPIQHIYVFDPSAFTETKHIKKDCGCLLTLLSKEYQGTTDKTYSWSIGKFGSPITYGIIEGFDGYIDETVENIDDSNIYQAAYDYARKCLAELVGKMHVLDFDVIREKL